MQKEHNRILTLLIWYVPVALVQLVSGRITVNSLYPWYRSLEKGWWTPPDWVFGPVWTLLYGMMAVSVWMIYHAKATRRQHSIAYVLFFTQLFVNGLWSFLFFRFHLLGLALADLGLLVLLVALNAYYFYRVRPLAGLLLVPYLLWSLYAFSLNAAIWWLN